jgi:hypothetical protein
MITLKKIVPNFVPPLVVALCLVSSHEALAGAAAGDAQAQARQVLVAPGDSRPPRAQVRVPRGESDAALAARRLLLGAAPAPRLEAATLQARLAPLSGARAVRAAREDAQAQARRLIHG